MSALFILSGSNMPAVESLANLLRRLGWSAVTMNFADLSHMRFDDRHVVLIDIDDSSGLQDAYRISQESPCCLVATLGTNDRPVDHVMHMMKPLGYIDLQILLIRANAPEE